MVDSQFDAAMTALRQLPTDTDDAGQIPGAVLADRMRQLVQARAMLDALLAAHVSVFDDRAGARYDGQTSTRAWLHCQLRLGGDAGQLVRVARQLAGLPQVGKAFTAGEITLEHAAAIAALVGRLGAQVLVEYEPILLELAKQVPPVKLRVACEYVFQLLDPDGGGDQAARQRRKRYLSAGRTVDGLVHLQGLLDAASGDVVLAALNAAMPAPAEYEERTPGQRRADALVQILGDWLGTGQAPTNGGLPAQVQVTVSLRALQALQAMREQTTTNPDPAGPESDPAESDPAESDPAESDPAEPDPEPAKSDPADPEPDHGQTSGSRGGGSQASGSQGGGSVAAGSWAGDSETIDTRNTDTRNVETTGAEGDPAETSYTDAETDQAETDQAETDQAETDQAETDQAEADQAEADQAEAEVEAGRDTTNGDAANGDAAGGDASNVAGGGGVADGGCGDVAGAWRPLLGIGSPFSDPTSTLLGDVPVLADGQPISIGEARRIACDAGIIPVVLDSRSEPLDIGRRSRVVPAGLRRAINLRDGGCRFPGCDRPPGWCEAHHIIFWADGGPTSLTNLISVCQYHHTLIHEGWRLIGNPAGAIRFERPDGTQLNLTSTPRCRPPTGGP